MIRRARLLDQQLLAAPRWVQRLAMAMTGLVMIGTSLGNVPRQYIDYSSLPLLSGIRQPDTYGTDTIADMYAAKVVLNDIRDMYTREHLEQTPLEAATWSKFQAAPYPPLALLIEAGLYWTGERTGIGFYGMHLGIACLFLGLSAWYFLQTRWYLFPLLYLNFGYLSARFVQVQDDTYLLMLLAVMLALLLARTQRDGGHLLMAGAIAIKLSPLYYVRHVTAMRPLVRALFLGILAAGLVLPWFVWDNYLYIFTFHEDAKGNVYDTIAAVLVVVPFSLVLWYVETRGRFDREDLIGWGAVPFAMFLGIKMRVTRHLLLVLLVPDKRGARNAIAALGLALHALMPRVILFGSVLYIDVLLLIAVLAWQLRRIGWDVVRDDLRQPRQTLKMMTARCDPA